MAVPPQRAPDVLGQSISDFLAQCRQIKTDGREALVAHHEACRRYWAENMRNGGSPPAHFPSSTAFALDKDFSRHWDEAASATAVDDECLRLKGVARIGIDEERQRHNDEWLRWHRIKEEVCVHHRQEAAYAKAVDNERLRLLAEERPQTTESSELAFAEVCCCHDTGMHIAMPAEGSRADERHRHEAAKQAAEPAVLRLAKNRG